MGNAKSQSRNRILALLPTPVRERVIGDCDTVTLGLKHGVYESDEPISSVYFPLTGVISLVADMGDSTTIEVATTGNEGMVGVPLLLGVDRSPLRAFSQVPGDSLRLSKEHFQKHLKNEPELSVILQRYVQALMMQISQSSACNRAHVVEQRCCRWLLMTRDRVSSDKFSLTQEFLGQMLGVRRATVGEVAGALQDAKLIEYRRGIVNVLNRRGLEKKSCSCYFIIRDEYNRLLNGKHQS